MKLDISAHRWKFLDPSRTDDYIAAYTKCPTDKDEPVRKKLARATTRRQFRTAAAILDRMKSGQRGVLLADDVGLGKTTIAVFCAMVFAGSKKKVRILAPNQMMARRWRQELKLHAKPVELFRSHLKLRRAHNRIDDKNIERLRDGTIQVSTHFKATQLACDLLIIDEAHRARNDKSKLAMGIEKQKREIKHLLILTATPFSINPDDLGRLLARVGGDNKVIKPMKDHAGLIDKLWNGQVVGEPSQLADKIVATAKASIEAMRPFVIRHGIDDLPDERRAFGTVCERNETERLEVSDELLEAMLRTDRALKLDQQSRKENTKRLNDPRYHVASGMLKDKLATLIKQNTATVEDPGSELARNHARKAQSVLRSVGRHPKIAHAVMAARQIVTEQNEKLLIFCDHHQPAFELTEALACEIRWAKNMECCPDPEVWRSAWKSVLPVGCSEETPTETKRRDNFIRWLVSDGIRSQIASWLGGQLQPELSAGKLSRLLKSKKARLHPRCATIADHAKELFEDLIDSESKSTRTILENANLTGMPGIKLARIAAVCEPLGSRLEGVFFPNQPDFVLAVFNSPFGPDVLVTTDRLSEGVDMHRFCRFLIHHELDPSPIRTVQRNGRLRRVNSWAARTNEPIEVSYPALAGTRDEKAVRIMERRLAKFDLLLGGVGGKINAEESDEQSILAAKVFDIAGPRLRKLRLGLNHRRKPAK